MRELEDLEAHLSVSPNPSMWADYEQAASWKIAGAQTEAAAMKGGEA